MEHSTPHGRTYMAGIAGGSASGKTFVLRSLRKLFRPEEVCIISQDDYYQPLHRQQKDEQGEVNFDLPGAIDHEAFLHDIQRLMRGKAVRRKEYNFNQPGVEAKELRFLPAPVIVVEGLFILHFEEIKKLLDLKIFMDSRDDIKLRRRLERDRKERGLSEEVILYQWNRHVYPAYKQYLLPYRDEADIIITNNQGCDKGMELLADHISRRLQWLEEK